MKEILKKYLFVAEKLFFYIFLLTMTLSVRKIVYMRQIRSSFNEYTSIYIYLSDIVLVCVFFLFILNNKKYILSNIYKVLDYIYKMFHVEHFIKKCNLCKNNNTNCSTWNNIIDKKNIVPRGTIIIKKIYTQVIHNYWIIFPLFAVFFSFLSILWTTEWKIGLFRAIKLAQFIALYFYVIHIVSRGTFKMNRLKMFHVEHLKFVFYKVCSTWNKLYKNININFFHKKDNNVPRGTKCYNCDDISVGNLFHVEQIDKHKLSCSTWNILKIIVFIGLLQSILAIFQFVIQKSIGLFWLKESIISPGMAGVAKIVFNNESYVRAYGLFPHPNILGGFLVFSILVTVLFIALFHVEQCNKKIYSNKVKAICSTWNKYIFAKWSAIVPCGTIILKTILIIQIIGLILTFSKSAIIGLSMGFFYVLFLKKKSFVPRGTKFSFRAVLFHVEQYKKIILLVLIATFSLLIIKPDYSAIFIKSLNERNFYINVSRGTILENPFLGVGIGQFIFQIGDICNAEMWQFQPVHNVYLLIATEMGLIIAFAFMFFVYFLLKNNCSTWNNCESSISNEINTYKYKLILIHGYLKAILLSFLFIMLFDHYFWDIQQGGVIFWLLCGLIAGINNLRKKMD